MRDNGLSAEQYAVMHKIVTEFLRENAITNLSAIRTEEGVWEKHIRDSLAATEILRKILKNKSHAKILDIGTGGGFPLLPLAIVFAEHVFFGLDSTAKKLAAIERIAKAAEVLNIKLLNGRAEELGHVKNYREQFDVVTARAVAPFPVLLELVSPFVKVGGSFVAYRGPDFDVTDNDLADLLNLKFVQKQEYVLTSGEQRVLWLYQKQAELSKNFPREVGLPKKKPLTVSDFSSKNH